MALGYKNPFYLKQAQQKQQSLYNGKVLLEKHDPPAMYDSEETLQLAQENRLKMKQLNKEIKPANYTKINHLLGLTMLMLDVQNFKYKFVERSIQICSRTIKSLANEANKSLAKHKALELEIERLLRAVVSQDIMSIVQSNSVIDTSNLQTELDCTKELFENCNIKRRMIMQNFGMIVTKSDEESNMTKFHTIKHIHDMQTKDPKTPGFFGGQAQVEIKRVNNTAKTRRPHHRRNSNIDRVPSKSKSSCLSNNVEKIEENYRNSQIPKYQKYISSKCNNITLAIRNAKSKIVCVMCKQYLVTANHDVCMLNYVNDMNSRADNQSANVSIRENQKKHKVNAKKSKELGSKGSLASSRPSKPRTCLSTSKPSEPSSKGFLISTSLLGSEVRKTKQAYEEEKYSAARRRMISIPFVNEDDYIPLGDIIARYSTSKTITPDLPIEEPDNSLSMGGEHLDTTPSVENLVPIPSEYEGIFYDMSDVPTCDNNHVNVESDLVESLINSDTLIVFSSKIDPILQEFVGELAHITPIPPGIVEADFDPNDDTSSDDDSFENIEYVDASPSYSELDSLEEVNDVDQEEKEFDLEDIFQIQDVILREKLLNVHRLISNIESLKDKPTPDRVLESPLFPISVTNSDSFLEESDTSLSHLDNSLPEFETFSDDTKETRSGSTTTHANYSLPEYDSFLFEIEPDQEGLISIDNSNNTLLELPEFESFHFDLSFPRPPSEPPDVEICLHFEPDAPVIDNFNEN
ncbi:hypothetical protein Tco_1437106 [Tanacetum coccineum]